MNASRTLSLTLGSLTLGLVVSLILCEETVAVVYNFDITFDGTSVSVDAGSTDPVGVDLSPGDSFVADLHASSGNFWRVDTPYSQSFPMSFIVSPSGERLGDVVSSFLLNGVEVANIPELAVLQQQVHIGGQNWTLPVGLEFDTVLMTYDLTSAIEVGGTNPVATIIQDRPDIFGSISNPERPFFRNPNISFNAIPEPASLSLAVLGLLWFGVGRRR